MILLILKDTILNDDTNNNGRSGRTKMWAGSIPYGEGLDAPSGDDAPPHPYFRSSTRPMGTVLQMEAVIWTKGGGGIQAMRGTPKRAEGEDSDAPRRRTRHSSARLADRRANLGRTTKPRHRSHAIGCGCWRRDPGTRLPTGASHQTRPRGDVDLDQS